MKRLLDILGASLGLLLVSPFLLIVAVLVWSLLGHPIIFKQKRPGLGGELFGMFKFRSMTDQRGIDGELLPDEQRLGRFGQFLRRSSLDELPELINVLRGDMSLVGPRPLLVEYLTLYNSTQARRHEVRPGITGWAQVNGRNAISWDERFKMDVWYVDNRSFLLDLKILWMTVLNVIKREGISQEGHATMPKFTGSEVDKS